MINALQQAIYLALGGDSLLSSLVAGVYDRPAQTTAYPYITVGETLCHDWSTKTSTGTECQLTLDIWSREGGRKETASIAQQVHSLLHDAALPLSGYSLVSLRMVASRIELEKDGWTYHGILTFRAFIEQNN